MKKTKIVLTNSNDNNQDMITQAQVSKELEAVINLKQKDLLNVIKLSPKELKSIKYGKDVTNYKVEFDTLKNQDLNIEENSIIILSMVKQKQIDDAEDKKMTNKNIADTLNLILREMNSFKVEVREEFKKVNTRLDKVENRLDKVETEVKEVKEEVNKVKAEVKEVKEEVNKVKTEVKEVKEEVNKVNTRLDNVETYVKDEFEKINKKFDDHMEKYHSEANKYSH